MPGDDSLRDLPTPGLRALQFTMLYPNLFFDTLHNYTRALSVALGYRDHATIQHSERVLGIAHAIGQRAVCRLLG